MNYFVTILKFMLKIKSHWNERWVLIKTPYPTNTRNYFLSNYGRVKSVDKETGIERLKKHTVYQTVYRCQFTLIENRAFSFAIHKLVAEYFLPPKEKDQRFVVHINGDKSNNHYKNLKYVTTKELGQIWKENIRNNPGKRDKSCYKMTETKVRLLKKQLKRGKTKKTILARNFNISYMQLNRIERGENWGHVEG